MADEILFERLGAVAVATLNRPESLNALTLGMIRAYAAQLARWAADPAVAAVVLRGTGDRAFCAGGDIRSVCRAKGSDDATQIETYFAEEYALDLAVSRLPKPHVSLWDGVTMGGGVGLSLYGSHRVATERTVFAMPETGVGFFCDVGATWFLPRLPGAVGVYLGLTGSRLGPADAVSLGLATHYVRSENLRELEDALAGLRLSEEGAVTVGGVLERFAEGPGRPPLDDHRAVLDRCFSAGSVEAILARLEAEGGSWAEGVLSALRQKSPTSLKVVHRSLQVGAALDLEGALTVERRLSRRFVASHDFCEGVRALLEDKDGAPRWAPVAVEDVSESLVDSYFEPSDPPRLQPSS